MKPSKPHFKAVLWVLVGLISFALLIARIFRPDLTWLTVAISVILVAAIAALVRENRRHLSVKNVSSGLNTAVTVLIVIAIVGVLNFLGYRYEYKIDLTQNKVNTLSDQTEKTVRGLKTEVKATLFARPAGRERLKIILDNYRALNPNFVVEHVDPDKEPVRATQAGVKAYDTLILTVGDKSQKLEDITEEKLTNALIKLGKDKHQQVCVITGHGEKPITGGSPEGFDSISKATTNQAYEIKELNLPQEQKIAEACDVILMIGATRAFFDPEVKAIDEYLSQGGRALIAIELGVRGPDMSAEIGSILDTWGVKSKKTIILDPVLRANGVDAAVPIVEDYAADHPITKDFKTRTLFPITRPLEIKTPATEGLKVTWLARTSPNSWGETDLAALSKGVGFDEGKDEKGPLNVGVAIEGKRKDSHATKNTRIVVYGSSLFANNNYSRFGGNSDLFMNSLSWLMEDESLISIRSREDTEGKLELTQQSSALIMWMVIVIIPLLVTITGIVIWIRRKRL